MKVTKTCVLCGNDFTFNVKIMNKEGRYRIPSNVYHAETVIDPPTTEWEDWYWECPKCYKEEER